MRWCVEHNKPLYNAANKKLLNYVQYVATGRHRARKTTITGARMSSFSLCKPCFAAATITSSGWLDLNAANRSALFIPPMEIWTRQDLLFQKPAFSLILIMRTWWCMKIDKLTSAQQNPKIGTPASTKDFEARRILGFPRRKNTFAFR